MQCKQSGAVVFFPSQLIGTVAEFKGRENNITKACAKVIIVSFRNL